MELDLDLLAVETLAEKVRTNFNKFDGVFLPEEYKLVAVEVENFEVRDDDVWVCSFQKSGTTWTQEMVWGITHDADLESAKICQNERFPFLEFSGVITTARVSIREGKKNLPDYVLESVKYCKSLPSPRHIKCHLPFNLLPRQIRTGEKKPKIIYVARNPKDTCVSFYHHSKLLEGFIGNIEQFCELFLGDRVNYASYWNHVIGFWEEQKVRSNILYLKFDDMKVNLLDAIENTASFLDKNLSEELIKILLDYLSFDKMKKNPAVNKSHSVEYIKKENLYGEYKPEGDFIRKGSVGQWKAEMSEHMIKRFDDWTASNLKYHQDLVL